ncbi:MAG: S41 family peptidase [Acholeplasma sp.]|nr:S41 family peptidase [Acholeplasma sp.]
MKRVLGIIVFLLTMMFLVACNKDTDFVIDEDTIIKTSFVNLSTEYPSVENSEVDIYYFKESNIPYIDIKDFFALLDGVYYYEELEFIESKDEQMTINIEVTDEDSSITTKYYSVIDFKEDSIEVNDLDFFDAYIKETSTNYGEGLVYLDPIINKGSAVNYEFGNYDIDLKVYNEKYLFPLQIANLIFNQSTYFDVYFNYEKIYGIDTADLDDETMKKIMTSKYNSYQLPDSVAAFNYNFMEFVIDYFYGLKNDRNISSAESFLTTYKNDLLDSEKSSESIFKITNALDDLHSSHIMRSLFNNKKKTTSYGEGIQGSNVASFYSGMQEVANAAADHFGYNKWTGEIYFIDNEMLNDETAIIYLFEFTVDTPKEVEDYLKSLGSSVKNVIIDISLNTGGNLGAVLRTFTLMTNKEIWYHYQNSLNKETVSFGLTGESSPYMQFNYYIKTSSITFSAANLMSSIAKELKIPVIGQKSSGGASSIMPVVFPDGSIVFISSNMVLSRVEEGKYLSIEKGVEVDYYIDSLYDNNQILEKIK